MKQIKVFVEDVAQGMGIDYSVNTWLESMLDEIEVESIQLSLAASPVNTAAGSSEPGSSLSHWPVAIMVVYRAK